MVMNAQLRNIFVPPPAASSVAATGRVPHPVIRVGASLANAVEVFHNTPELRLLPVVDIADRPVGAVFEASVRRILFNPFGHALMSNPSFGQRLDLHISQCPVVDAGLAMGEMLDAYAASGGTEGLILTRSGRFDSVLPNRVLLRMAAEREGKLAKERIERLRQIDRASALFQKEATALSEQLTAASSRMLETAGGMAERSTVTSQSSIAVERAAKAAVSRMRDVAQQGDGLADAVEHVRRRTVNARRATEDAVAVVGASSVRARELAETTGEVGDVVSLIQKIAGQVNMLAINATIEAARAGPAGRGFAVVASEVKSLAAQTHQAAAGITSRMAGICAGIAEVSAGHAGMEAVIARVEGISSSVEDAVAEQRSAAQTIALGVADAVDAGNAIETSVADIQRNAVEAAQRAGELKQMAGALATSAKLFGARVGAFIGEVRAA